MAIDDKLEKALDYFDEGRELDVVKEIRNVLIPAIPFAGAPISALLSAQGQRRVAERVRDVFQAVKERMDEFEESQIDRTFFNSDEFMTILRLALEQIQGIHDKQKLAMIANGIANAGLKRFSDESRKELFVRVLRDLAPEHLHALKFMRDDGPNTTRRIARNVKPTPQNQGVFQTLAANGLVTELLVSEIPSASFSNYRSEREIKNAVENIIRQAAPQRFYQLNDVGVAFLDYFEAQTGR